MRVFLSAFFLFFMFILGLWITQQTSYFPKESYLKEFLDKPSSRDPAAIRRIYDFSGLEGLALEQAAKNRLISGFNITEEAGSFGLSLGHYALKGTNGRKTFACERYSRIILQFEGDSPVASGEKPSMEIEGKCEISPTDANLIAPLWVPARKILREPVADGEFDFREGRPIKITFSNLSDEWPKQWRLQGIQLNSSDASRSVVIADGEIRQLSEDPIILKFH